MTKENLNGQNKSVAANAIEEAIKNAFNQITEECLYGVAKINDNWDVCVCNSHRTYEFSLNYTYGEFMKCEARYILDFDDLSDFDILCGRSIVDEVIEEFIAYIYSNIESEKVESIVTEVAKAPYIDTNSAYIAKGWKLGWLKHKDVLGQIFVDYTIYHNDEKVYKIGTVALSDIKPIVEVVCKLIND